MQHLHERRVSGVRRVPIERIVDICGSSDPKSAFQGRAVDVSGRGMQIRAAHLPALRDAIVLRFQEHGQDVIAEGEVVWRQARASGGEFGVRFTALDSRSVQVLKALCGVPGFELEEGAAAEQRVRAGAPAPRGGFEPAGHDAALGSAEPDHDTYPTPPVALGVRLHIAGLTAPMQAHIKAQAKGCLEVGSRLDFLRVGRSLEVEDLACGGRRSAHIEAVQVHIDEASQVPELLVSMRYLDARQTPAAPAARLRVPARAAPVALDEGAVPELELQDEVDGAEDEPGMNATDVDGHSDSLPPPLPRPARGDEHEREPARAQALDPESGQDDADLLRERLDGVLGGVSLAARAASVQMARLGGMASRGASWLWAQAGRSARAAQRSPAPRRRTAAPPRSPLRSSPLRNPQLSVQRPRSAETPAPAARRRGSRAILWSALAVLAVVSIGSLARRLPLGGPVPAAARVEPVSPAATSPALVPAPNAADPSAAAAELGTTPSSPPGADGAAVSGAAEPSTAPALDDDDALEAEPARSRGTEPAFSGSTSRSRSSGALSEEFGQGRLRRPVIHRLRLDQPGEGLRGERTPTGFEVTIPGRRVLESAAGIARRDGRIAKVSALHGPQGARVSFRFREAIPAYKVRLRKDFVEFLISSD